MIRKIIVLASLLLCAHVHMGFSQSPPPEWDVLRSPKYFYSLQYGSNPDGLSSEKYFEELTVLAISALARQMEVKVNETAELETISNSGVSSISYSSRTSYTTDVKLNLVNTKNSFSKKDNVWFTIAYIDKESAISFFKKEIEDNLSTAERLYSQANDLISLGYKDKAKNELSESIKHISKTEEAFYWLKMCGIASNDYSSLLSIRNNINLLIQQKIAQLGHSNVIFISCSAGCFGTDYKQLEGIIKSKISSDDRSFSSSQSLADWIITIKASAREHNSVSYGTLSSYFCYVDANLTLYKVATGQTIYEGSLTEKGGSTISFIESANDAYTRIASKIIMLIEDRIE